MKHYALVSECGRQLDCKFFENLEEATTELELTFKHCLQGRHSEAYIKEDKHEAFIVDDCGCADTPIDNNCNFKIFEIKLFLFEFRSIQNGLSFRRIFNG